jgi:hypothetical protein
MIHLTINQLSPQTSNAIEVNRLPVFDNNNYLLKPFDNVTLSFFDTVSKSILANKTINYLPEIAALGFWLRKTNLVNLKHENQHLLSNPNFITAPLGKVFHICPANVDTMFFYSLTVSILMGNKNILRISNRMEAQQVTILFTILNEVMNKDVFVVFKNFINIISYEHNETISNFLSSSANARVIWGGDQTIGIFKKFTTSPRTKDIVFADRVSMLCINCESYLKLNEMEVKNVMHYFYNDAYTFDQMGCSSPQTIYFIGNQSNYNNCVNKFQIDASSYLKDNYKVDLASIASLKLNRMINDALENTISSQLGNNYIKFLTLNSNIDESKLHGCGGGYFYIKNIENINQLVNLHNPKIQTICYWGLSSKELDGLKLLANGEGIDRIVPLGQALNFNYIWDGYNLFDELSKKVYVK